MTFSMTSKPSPSSSSDVEEEEGGVPSASKRLRKNLEERPGSQSRESDSTGRAGGGVAAASLRVGGSNSSGGGGAGSSGNSGPVGVRGGSQGSKTNTGYQPSNRCLKEEWRVLNTSGLKHEAGGGKDGGRGGEEPSSSQGIEPAELASLQARLREREVELHYQRLENERFLRELQESVECPVCFSIPRAPPVPCCQNGHVICAKCKDKVEVCPTCRIPMVNCVSQVAATIIQKIQHPCDFKEAGCDARCDIGSIAVHEERCGFRLVRCPHWACDEQISLTGLTSHVISSECGDNYMAKPLPYQEEIEYTRALDDQDGNSFWRPSLLQSHNITFYLQIEKCGKNKQWYFYVQMEGSSSECERYETRISVCKFPASDRYSISYYGKVCPIDIKGAEELDQDGCGLNVRDAVMEKIFVVDTATNETSKEGEEMENGGGGTTTCGGRVQSGEKEEGEVGDHGEEGDGERFKFWVKVDIFRAAD